DQLIRMRKFLTEKGLWSEEQEAAIIEKTQIEVKDALDASRKLLQNLILHRSPLVMSHHHLYKSLRHFLFCFS
ncbi:hypothetical protein PT078_09190, partial [Erysipelothrix rhusiopathiae]|nr:hypothetical protein [Erysipelothrix rhusiopathiae]